MQAPAGRRVLRVVPGPEVDWLTGGSLHTLAARRFVVDAASDRVGVRLRTEDHLIAGLKGERAGQMAELRRELMPPMWRILLMIAFSLLAGAAAFMTFRAH